MQVKKLIAFLTAVMVISLSAYADAPTYQATFDASETELISEQTDAYVTLTFSSTDGNFKNGTFTLASSDNTSLEIGTVSSTDSVLALNENTYTFTFQDDAISNTATFNIPLNAKVVTEEKNPSITISNYSLTDDSDQIITPTLTSDTISFTVNPIVLKGNITFANDITSLTNFQVDLIDSQNLIYPTSLELSVDKKSIIVTPSNTLLPENYTVSITAPGYLDKTQTQFTITADTENPLFTKSNLLAGNYNGDTQIDIYDFFELCKTLKTFNETTDITTFDLNRDGSLTTADLTTLVNSWEKEIN